MNSKKAFGFPERLFCFYSECLMIVYFFGSKTICFQTAEFRLCLTIVKIYVIIYIVNPDDERKEWLKMKKTAVGALLAAVMCLTSLSSCEVYLVKKNEEEQPTTYNSLPTPTEEAAKNEPVWVEEGKQSINGIVFEDMSDKTMFVTTPVYLRDIPSKEATKTFRVNAGTILVQNGYSSDIEWARVVYDKETWYIKSSYIAEEYEEEKQILTDPRDENQPGDGEFIYDPFAGNHEGEEPTTTETTTTPVHTDNRKSNIEYPASPPSVSEENGMSFADTQMDVTVIQGTADVYSIPFSSGTKIATLSENTTVVCTGVGEGGWCRVIMPDGVTIGFVETSHLMR